MDRIQMTRRILSRVRAWIENTDPGAEFRERLKLSLENVFGSGGTYGVFVRSDTNIEDLPGFTGAGLNLTVPHVVGFEEIVQAISRVWASPFTERAFGWRQAVMDQPEHVYASVLLLKSVPVDKSGVMVTVDVDTGRGDQLTLAASEGVGGAVSGQSAEELRIDTATGTIRLMAEATEPLKRILLPQGGISKVPASGNDTLLQPEEIDQLRELAISLPERFPSLRDPSGHVIPADVEFGFLNHRLVLFQIRPFVENSQARKNSILIDMDVGLKELAHQRVDLSDKPGSDAS
jgi:rifampicin phosphotransferase